MIQHPDYSKQLEDKLKSSHKKNQTLLKSIQNQINRQQKIKQNALEKFISDEITKKDYDGFVEKTEDKLKELNTEYIEIEKLLSTSNQQEDFNEIKAQLSTFLELGTITKEMLLRFVDRIEVTEDKGIKISYKFAGIEGL